MLLAAALFAGLSEEGFDRLNPKHFLDVVGLPSVGGLDPAIWFGVIGAGGLLLSYLAAGVVARGLDVSRPAVAARLLLALDALTMAGMLASLSPAASRSRSGRSGSPPWSAGSQSQSI